MAYKIDLSDVALDLIKPDVKERWKIASFRKKERPIFPVEVNILLIK
jgi:hypothetical protein